MESNEEHVLLTHLLNSHLPLTTCRMPLPPPPPHTHSSSFPSFRVAAVDSRSSCHASVMCIFRLADGVRGEKLASNVSHAHPHESPL